MSVVDRNTHWCRLSLKDTIKAIASILIPVMIGLFTLVLAWQEHIQGQANRQNDIEIANNERTAQIRLEEFRRDQDRQLAATIQMDSVLNRFFQEMSELILEKNINFTDETMRKTFVRPKILATLRQLDPARKSSIIKYLYDSMLLSGDNNSLDLSGADLSNIDLGYSFRFKGKFAERIFPTMSMHPLSLPNVRLVNASFANLYLSWSNFERSDLTGANFRGTSLVNAIFHQTNLSFTNFTDAVTVLVDFEEADLTGSNLNKEQLDAAFSSYGARLPNGQQQYERINRLKNLATKECSLDKWDETYGVDIVYLPSNKHQCAFRGQTFNATLLGTLGTTGFQHLINTDSAGISLELDVQGNRKPQDFVTLPVNINLRFFAPINSVNTLIDKDVNILEQPSINNLNDSTNFYRLTGVSICPLETRKIEIEIKLTSGAVFNNIKLYIVRPKKPETEYDIKEFWHFYTIHTPCVHNAWHRVWVRAKWCAHRVEAPRL